MAKLSKDKRDRLVLVVVLTLMIVGALWYLVIKPANAQFVVNQGRLADAQSKLQKGRTAVKQADATQTELEAQIEKQNQFERSMASGDVYTWARQLIIEKARAGHEAVNVSEVTKPAEGKVGVLPDFPYKAAIFTVRGSGYYHDIGRFIADFENQYPYFQVRNLTLAAGSDASPTASQAGSERIYFTMDVVALIKPQE
jgi:Tfp pilus assembly protein PilO